MKQDHYKVLGVDRDADQKAIKKAFRRLAAKHHPDKNKDDPEAEDRFKEVNTAYSVIGDADRRAMYDELGDVAEQLDYDPEKVAQYKQARRGGFQGFGGGAEGADLGDILSQMFGGHRNGSDPFARGGEGPFGFRGGSRKGPDQRATLRIDFMTAATGGERTLNLDGRSLNVRIPAGVTHGGTLRLRGKGAPGPGGPGDLLLTLDITPHPDFTRDGDDIRTRVPITLGEALRGARIEVPTLDGSVRVKVPEGAQPGQTLRLKGKGVARKGRDPGSLLVDLDVRLPPVGDADVADAIDALEALYEEPVR